MTVCNHRRAASLLELLVVLAILGVLIALLLPAVQKVRWYAEQMTCRNNLRQVGLALHQHHDVYLAFPSGCSYRNGAAPQPHLSWCSRLLPFLEREALWQQTLVAFQKEKFFEVVPPHTALGTPIATFSCPSDGRVLSPYDMGDFKVAFTSYLGVGGTDYTAKNGVLFLDSNVRLIDITDGTSSTLMVGERPPSSDRILGWWYAGWGQSRDGSAEMWLGALERNVSRPGRCPLGPYAYGPGRLTNYCDVFHFWSLHTGGSHFLFADGSVHFLGYTMSSILPALATRSGGEVVETP